ncbi:MAG: hypothetical protein WCF25_01825, partial [Acidimicrobiales bacterium]
VLVHGTSSYEQILENDHNLVSRVMPGKVWIQGPERQSAQGSLGIGSSNIVGQLQILAQQGNAVVALAPSTINGESVYGYQVTISQHSISAAYKRLEAQGGAMAQAVKAFLQSGSISGPVIKLWLNADHLLVSENVDLSISTGGDAASGDMTVDFSDYGRPVSISVPAPNAVTTFSAFEAAANHGHNGW